MKYGWRIPDLPKWRRRNYECNMRLKELFGLGWEIRKSQRLGLNS